jgi:hypothetical protein
MFRELQQVAREQAEEAAKCYQVGLNYLHGDTPQPEDQQWRAGMWRLHETRWKLRKLRAQVNQLANSAGDEEMEEVQEADEVQQEEQSNRSRSDQEEEQKEESEDEEEEVEEDESGEDISVLSASVQSDVPSVKSGIRPAMQQKLRGMARAPILARSLFQTATPARLATESAAKVNPRTQLLPYTPIIPSQRATLSPGMGTMQIQSPGYQLADTARAIVIQPESAHKPPIAVGQAKWIHENLKKTKSDTLNGCQKSST